MMGRDVSLVLLLIGAVLAAAAINHMSEVKARLDRIERGVCVPGEGGGDA